MKFTKPETRYLAKSARETLRWARRYERTIKLNMSDVRIFNLRLISASAACVDGRRRDAKERMELARRLEMA
jgi:hypothetical protein